MLVTWYFLSTKKIYMNHKYMQFLGNKSRDSKSFSKRKTKRDNTYLIILGYTFFFFSSTAHNILQYNNIICINKLLTPILHVKGNLIIVHILYTRRVRENGVSCACCLRHHKRAHTHTNAHAYTHTQVYFFFYNNIIVQRSRRLAYSLLCTHNTHNIILCTYAYESMRCVYPAVSTLTLGDRAPSKKGSPTRIITLFFLFFIA